MMIPKRNLRKRVILGETTNQNLEIKKSQTNVKDEKKTYNLRKTYKLDRENKNSNHQINVKESCILKSTAGVPNHQSKNNNVNNENKVKLRGKRQIMKLDHSSKTVSRVSGCKIVEKGVKNQKKLNSVIDTQKTGTLPIWRKNLLNSEKICSQKNFDVYDIAQDEDLSRIVRRPPKKLKKISKKGEKIVKRIRDKNPDKGKETKSVQPNSNPSCNMPVPVKSSELPLQIVEKLTEKPCVEVESNKQLSMPEAFDAIEINILEPLNFEDELSKAAHDDNTTLLLNVADVFEKSLLHPKMTSTPDNAVMTAAPAKNNLILNDISHIASNNRNILRVVIDTPDPIPIKSSNKVTDLALFKLPEQKEKNPTKLKSSIKQVLKMTSTPAMAADPPENNNFIQNDISQIPSDKRNIVQAVIDTPDPLPAKKSSKRRADVTLFESPEPKKKNPIQSKSPLKLVRINLIENFLLSPVKNLEESIKKPAKAYHSPDNFKTHLAYTKRVSAGMKVVKRKSKEDLLLEQLAKHFEEVSSTELCIE